MLGGTTYGLFVLLPEKDEAYLRAWTGRTQNASWPAWRGHITLINTFTLLSTLEQLRTVLREVGREVEPFEVNLDRVVQRPNLVREGLETVMLVGHRYPDETPLSALQEKLVGAVKQLKKDGTAARKVSQRPYHPHISLTLGLPDREARALAGAAEQDELAVRFCVTGFHLIGFGAGYSVADTYAIALGEGADETASSPLNRT